jgi:hypothetical protein
MGTTLKREFKKIDCISILSCFNLRDFLGQDADIHIPTLVLLSVVLYEVENANGTCHEKHNSLSFGVIKKHTRYHKNTLTNVFFVTDFIALATWLL